MHEFIRLFHEKGKDGKRHPFPFGGDNDILAIAKASATTIFIVFCRLLLFVASRELVKIHEFIRLLHQAKRTATPSFSLGGDNEIRTRGLLVANEALYQLSHIPKAFLL